MAYGTIAVDTISTSSGQILGAGNATGFKNRIINGDMRIDQRNAGASVTPASGTYILDRFWVQLSQASKFSIQQTTGNLSAGFSNSLKITSLAATTVGAGDFFTLQQSIEGLNVADLSWGTASAKPVTLSFQVFSSLTGTFGGALTNAGFNRSYPFTYTVSTANTWTTVSVTIPGDTAGTWLTTNAIGIQVIFGLGIGSVYSGTAGAWAGAAYLSATGATSVVGTSGATFYITGVQLEVGSTATSFDVRDYGRELILCQRYLPSLSGAGNVFGFGIAQSSSGALCTVQFPVTPRVTPTGLVVSSASHFNVSDFVAADAAASAIAINGGLLGLNCAALLLTTSAVLTSSRSTSMYSNNAAAKLLFTGCEL